MKSLRVRVSLVIVSASIFLTFSCYGAKDTEFNAKAQEKSGREKAEGRKGSGEKSGGGKVRGKKAGEAKGGGKKARGRKDDDVKTRCSKSVDFSGTSIDKPESKTIDPGRGLDPGRVINPGPGLDPGRVIDQGSGMK